MNSPLLTILTFIPLIGGLLLLCFGKEQKSAVRSLGLAFSLVSLGLTIYLWSQFNPAGGIQFKHQVNWVSSLGIQYYLGVDGLGLLMVALTSLVMPFALLASWKIEENAKLYFSLMLFLQAGLYGTFTALNFFHWFIFWELCLIPAFFLIKIWGGPQRTGAAYQFFVYTMFGSAAMLLAFLAISAATGTFDFITLAQKAQAKTLAGEVFAKIHLFNSPETLMTVLFMGVVLGFAVKVPLMPFHTWLPGAYSEAPASTSMVLTGVMSKMGVYGFLRLVLPIFPEQTRAMLTPLLWLAVATIVFGAAAAFAQRDLKRIVAYSSINHLGYCLLGLFAAAQVAGPGVNGDVEKSAALNGVLIQMFNHGLTASALFFFVGLLEQRSGQRGLNDFGGLRRPAPVFAGLMGITLFASLGLPGLNGFVGEFLIFKGVFPLVKLPAIVSMLGLLITAIFLLTLFQRVFCGPVRDNRANWPDLTLGEKLTVMPFVVLMFVIGIFPQVILGVINPTVIDLVKVLSF